MRCCASRALTSLLATDPGSGEPVARAARRRGPPLSLVAPDPGSGEPVARAARRRGPQLSLLALVLVLVLLGCGGSGDEPGTTTSAAAQRPEFRAHTAPAPEGARADVLLAARRAITADAQARARTGELHNRALRTRCKPQKGEDPEADVVVYDCLAVTYAVKATIGAPPLESGYPFQLRVDYPAHEFGWCKIVPVGGEGARQAASEMVEPDSACGGL